MDPIEERVRFVELIPRHLPARRGRVVAGELHPIAVCSDSGLAAVDRVMASENAQASAVATPEQREVLRETAHRFYAYRDQSGSPLQDTYSRACESAAVSLGRWRFSLGLTIYSAIMWRRKQHIIGRVEPGQPGHDKLI